MTTGARRYDHDPWLLAAIAGLLVVGLLFVASATGQGEGQSLLAKQLLWVALGILAFLLAVSIHDSTWAEFSHIFYWVLLVVLVWLLIFGRAISGARGGSSAQVGPPTTSRPLVVAASRRIAGAVVASAASRAAAAPVERSPARAPSSKADLATVRRLG